jgi:hypothetical protein
MRELRVRGTTWLQTCQNPGSGKDQIGGDNMTCITACTRTCKELYRHDGLGLILLSHNIVFSPNP